MTYLYANNTTGNFTKDDHEANSINPAAIQYDSNIENDDSYDAYSPSTPYWVKTKIRNDGTNGNYSTDADPEHYSPSVTYNNFDRTYTGTPVPTWVKNKRKVTNKSSPKQKYKSKKLAGKRYSKGKWNKKKEIPKEISN
ncbi:Putative peptidoglycan binding domain protein [Candida maltosa Xu316]|uniref:Putative peptidoglycan binding domain protein n=1 Tax=Candida maltosa (strain Xu316) TaxID=1245528 RepID=M3IIN2_CANMX|nr:Putative peptidoglycan binding domain protein [Candida maltosa Xu316]